jgi:carbamoyltransferase
VLALADSGSERLVQCIAELVPATEDGSFRVDQRHFRFAFDSERLFGSRLEALLGPAFPARGEGSEPPGPRAADVAAGLWRVLELRLCALLRELARRAPSPNLCLAGDLARLRRLNAAAYRAGPFQSLHVPTAPAEAGAALGAALLVSARLTGKRPSRAESAALGEVALAAPDEPTRVLAGPAEARSLLLAELLGGRVVGWARGRFELGRQSLGARVLLGDPFDSVACRSLRQIRLAEPFAPLSLAVPEERADELFEIPPGAQSALRNAALTLRPREALRARLKAALGPASEAVACTVVRTRDPELYALLEAWGAARGMPVVILESLEQRGLPMARTAGDTLDLLQRSALELVVIDDRLYERAGARPLATAVRHGPAAALPKD